MEVFIATVVFPDDDYKGTGMPRIETSAFITMGEADEFIKDHIIECLVANGMDRTVLTCFSFEKIEILREKHLRGRFIAYTMDWAITGPIQVNSISSNIL